MTEASNQQFIPALTPHRTAPRVERLAQDRVEAVRAPHRQQRGRVAAADVDDVLLEHEAAQVAHLRSKRPGRTGSSRGRRRRGRSARRSRRRRRWRCARKQTRGRSRRARPSTKPSRSGLSGSSEKPPPPIATMAPLIRCPAGPAAPRRRATRGARGPTRSRCTRVPSSRSSSRRGGGADRLDHPPAGADEDPLLRLGLDPHERAHDGQPVLARRSTSSIDDLDRVRAPPGTCAAAPARGRARRAARRAAGRSGPRPGTGTGSRA